ncbi:MAG: zf-HC2 domain-containing protein [Gemmataceae bacterium]
MDSWTDPPNFGRARPAEMTMLGCHGCQELMLDFLYDLLEEADQRALRDHLAGCPGCQAALEKARAHQQLLARAARLSFPNVQFTPPDEAAATPAAPLVPAAGDAPAIREVHLPVRPRLTPARSWTGWAVAAGVLVAVFAAGVPIYRAHRDYTAAQTAVIAHDVTVAEARKQVEERSRRHPGRRRPRPRGRGRSPGGEGPSAAADRHRPAGGAARRPGGVPGAGPRPRRPAGRRRRRRSPEGAGADERQPGGHGAHDPGREGQGIRGAL